MYTLHVLRSYVEEGGRERERERERERFKKRQAHHFITTGLKKETTQV